MKIEALNNNLIIDLLEDKSLKEGIVRSKNAAPTLRWGKVEHVGPGTLDSVDAWVTPDEKPGDVVYCMAHGIEETGTDELGSPTLRAVSTLDVLAKLKNLESLEIEPSGNYVEIQKLERPEATPGGILRPSSVLPPPNIAVVKSVGPGWIGITGKRIPVGVNQSDFVAYKPYETLIVDFSSLGINKHTYLVSVRSILARLTLTKEETKDILSRYKVA